jgi:Calcineurin-like phosphoesterase
MVESGDPRPLVVTARGLPDVAALEAAAPADAEAVADPMERAKTINRYARIAQALEQEAAEVDPDVFITLQNRDASLLQARLAEEAEAGGGELETVPLPAGGLEVKFEPGLGDVWGWAKSLFDWIDRKKAHPIVRPPSDDFEPLPNSARIGILSDWATGLYGAPVSAKMLAETGPWDALFHLGDVYYAGTPGEVAKRFAALWPTDSANVNRALNGNHEMYSGGFGYFDTILRDFRQSGSYFALANDHWLLVGLDTAYVDHDMDETQVEWLNRVVARADGRRVLLFSHQQLFSRLDKQGPKLVRALKDPLLQKNAITAWYWGHEHDCVVYDRHAEYGLFARCVGNGGVPAPRRGNVKEAPAEHSVAGITWRRLGATPDSPTCLALDGTNPYIRGKEGKFVPHGYMTLELRDEHLTERVHLPDGTEIWSNDLV